jgi:transcriptional regulator with XRE-family HTH domain
VDDLDQVLTGVGPRLRALRHRRDVTLAELAEATGISESTLSRLETGERQPTLKLLLPLARAHRVPLDELVGAPETGDPRLRLRPYRRNGTTVIPLHGGPGGVQAAKMIIPAKLRAGAPDPRSHAGHGWLYVLGGRLRFFLGGEDLVLTRGEAADFDTHVPHWMGNADDQAVELLVLFGPQGERARVRARTTR